MLEQLESGSAETATGRPQIINIGSISAYTSSPARGEYCISKAGVGMMTLLFADRLAERAASTYARCAPASSRPT